MRPAHAESIRRARGGVERGVAKQRVDGKVGCSGSDFVVPAAFEVIQERGRHERRVELVDGQLGGLLACSVGNETVMPNVVPVGGGYVRLARRWFISPSVKNASSVGAMNHRRAPKRPSMQRRGQLHQLGGGG